MRAVTRSGRRASQAALELKGFIDILRRERVESYCEIGARHGDTFFEVMRHLPVGSKGVAVDLPGGKWGVSSSVSDLQAAACELRKMGYIITVILGNSREVDIINQIQALSPFGGCLIDGDHRYEGVHADWQNYGSMAEIVAFHDINGEGQKTNDREAFPVEVPALWKEIKPNFRHVEIIDTEYKMGIGVLWH